MDLIISDINMPILNGLEMIKKIKDINKNVPIIVTTAFSNKEYLLEAIDIGVDKYVLKPVDVSKLLQAMSQSLNYHELKDLYLDSLTNLSNRNKLKKRFKKIQLVNLWLYLILMNLLQQMTFLVKFIGDKILKEVCSKIEETILMEMNSCYIESNQINLQ
ncbi:MAG: response regulator, partial [Aliarcobacter cryaerophilus]|nr:response regulator [Aliarcobacter cryaerophilus]